MSHIANSGSVKMPLLSHRNAIFLTEMSLFFGATIGNTLTKEYYNTHKELLNFAKPKAIKQTAENSKA